MDKIETEAPALVVPCDDWQREEHDCESRICGACTGALQLLGIFGRIHAYRCRDCGIGFNATEVAEL